MTRNTGTNRPVVLVLAGHDPTGGAGIQADIEAIAANNCHAATVITCLTTQNTTDFKQAWPVDAGMFQEQVRYILADMPVAACKIGVIADLAILYAVADILANLPPLPVVLDPVISAGTGQMINSDAVYRALREKIMPRATVMTPNTVEAGQLSSMSTADTAAEDLLQTGCQSVLITGAHADTDTIINTLYRREQQPVQYRWQRLPGHYHGSGCTLAASLAAQLAQGNNLETAVAIAQEYTWQTLKQAMSLGKSQLHPNRFFQH